MNFNAVFEITSNIVTPCMVLVVTSWCLKAPRLPVTACPNLTPATSPLLLGVAYTEMAKKQSLYLLFWDAS
jgi:hypothetical protein